MTCVRVVKVVVILQDFRFIIKVPDELSKICDLLLIYACFDMKYLMISLLMYYYDSACLFLYGVW